jgi:hypothetical protein
VNSVRLGACAGFVILATVVLIGPRGAQAQARTQFRPCGQISLGGRAFDLSAKGVTCPFARTLLKNYFRTGLPPAGWQCSATLPICWRGSSYKAATKAVKALPHRSARFVGYVAGMASGKGHKFFVGDGLFLVFLDRRAGGTSYRVCWQRGNAGGVDLHCWRHRTGRAGALNRISTAAPEHPGYYTVNWFVGGRVVAHWWFDNGIGD